jgi:hypothetical protein
MRYMQVRLWMKRSFMNRGSFIFYQIKAKESIRDEGSWMSAFNIYTDAVLFVYPHCSGELRFYMHDLFASVKPYKERAVVEFDIKFLKRLSDAMYTYHGVESCHPFLFGSYSESAGSQRVTVWRQGRVEAEICRRFNAGVPHYNCW